MSDGTPDCFPAPPKYYLQFALEGARVRPPSPPEGSYEMFGDKYAAPGVDELRPLTESGKTPLCPTLVASADPQHEPPAPLNAVAELKDLTHSIVLSYIQLLDVLASNPANAMAKVDDLDVCQSPTASPFLFHAVLVVAHRSCVEQLLFANVHQLLNEFRPWQARQDLIKLMEAQIARRRATIAELQAAMAEACDSLREGFREIDAAEQAEAAASAAAAAVTTTQPPQ